MRLSRLPSIVVTMAITLSACGGGGGSDGGTSAGSGFTGTTSAATLSDQQTAEALARTASEGVTQAVTQDASIDAGGGIVTPFAAAGGAQGPAGDALRIVRNMAAPGGGVSPLAVERVAGPCGGELEVTTPDDGEIVENSPLQASAVYASFCLFEGVFINGRIDMSAIITDRQGPSGSFTASYDLAITVPDDPAFDLVDERVRGSQECTFAGQTVTCTWSQNFASSRGGTIRIENMAVDGDEVSGFTVDGRIYDSELGFVDITTTQPITFDCPDGGPNGGAFSFSDSDGNTVTVTFNGCDSITVTFNGNASVIAR